MGLFNKLEGCWVLGWEDLGCSIPNYVSLLSLYGSLQCETQQSVVPLNKTTASISRT